MKALWILCALLWCTYLQAGSCQGRFLNPLTEVCWNCLFPLTIGGVSVAGKGQADTDNPKSPICSCPGVPIGVTVGLWEPIKLIEVTRTPYCMVSLGGIQVAKGFGATQQASNIADDRKTSSYHVHWYEYPLINLLGAILDFGCFDPADKGFDITVLTELDPSWQDESIAALLEPESLAAASLPMQLACTADAIAASTGLPLDSMPWCVGAQGSVFPNTGYVQTHVSGTQASALLAARTVYRQHKWVGLPETSGTQALCAKLPLRVWKKSQYRLQMAYPSPPKGSSGCVPFGKPTVFWESGKEYPVKGEDFVYVLWRKKNCCAL